jgi:hypothetical protein
MKEGAPAAMLWTPVENLAHGEVVPTPTEPAAAANHAEPLAVKAVVEAYGMVVAPVSE